jgi:hypothetical protein
VRARDLKLIDQIEDDALSPDTSISETLRKLMALGGQVRSTELREWASRELRGYAGSGVELPRYRRQGAVIQIDLVSGTTIMRGRQVSPSHFPKEVRDLLREEVPLGQGIGEIEAMAEQAHERGGYIQMTVPNSQDVARLWDHQVGDPYQQITGIYWSLNEAALRGVIDQVKTTLVELVAEMRAGMPDSDEAPSGEMADKAVHVVVYGDEARVNVTAATGDGAQVQNTAQQAGDNGGTAVHHTTGERVSLSRKIGGAIVGVAVIVTAVVTLALWQGWGT